MSKLLILCAVCLLAGCGNSSKWSTAFKEMKDECDGVVSYTLTHSQWNSSISMTCDEWDGKIHE